MSAENNFMNYSNYKVGMLVRVPTPEERSQYSGDYRLHRLGRIISIEITTKECSVSFDQFALNGVPELQIDTVSLHLINRCRVLAMTEALYIPDEQTVVILESVQPSFTDGEFLNYYIKMQDGQIRQVVECDLMPPSHRQDINPLEQLTDYELNHPSYLRHRNNFVSVYAELQNATLGLSSLVNTRVLLLAHQAEVITRVLSNNLCRYILADEVGLGKTIEACVILKGLLDRYGGLSTLIVVPDALVQQWYQELDQKFWLRFNLWQKKTVRSAVSNLLITHEALETDERLWKFVQSNEWDLLIADEAHHISRQSRLYERIQLLSRDSDRVLLLSATPIQHRRVEYLRLLRLLHPQRYNALNESSFEEIIKNQKVLYSVVQTVQESLEPDFYEIDEFIDLMEPAVAILGGDVYVQQQITSLTELDDVDVALALSRQLIVYITENYRIESRVIRNRRTAIEPNLLPKRDLDDYYTYTPTDLETDAYNELMLYIQQSVAGGKSENIAYCRALCHAFASSPDATLNLLDVRWQAMMTNTESRSVEEHDFRLLWMQSPRHEYARLQALVNVLHPFTDETRLWQNAYLSVQRWQVASQAYLTNRKKQAHHPTHDKQQRLGQILAAIKDTLDANNDSKVLVFTGWSQTLAILDDLLRSTFGSRTIATFHVGIQDSDALEAEADRFQSDPACRVILCDELGGEGRNFQIASVLIHADVPWSPARIEQRIGRIDRLGRTGVVTSIIPFAHNQIESDLVNLFQGSFQVFTQSMSGLEIIIEEVQNRIDVAFHQDIFDGLRRLLPDLKAEVEQMRHEIELERIYEEMAVNTNVRHEIAEISEMYGDGASLREGVSEWANHIGLVNQFDAHSDILTYHPKQFSLKAMQNAKLMSIPNMEDANERAIRSRRLVIQGTFNRTIAIQREDLVFFAPAEPWTRATINNALESERGRCAAICLESPKIEVEWEGFEFLFTLQTDPRPLYALGLDSIHLYRTRGILGEPIERIFIDLEGKILSYSHPIRRFLIDKRLIGKHLGKRQSGELANFRQHFPDDEWKSLTQDVASTVWAHITNKYLLDYEAEELLKRLEQQHLAEQAVQIWLRAQGIDWDRSSSIDDARLINALAEGVRHPLIRLESVAFWRLLPTHESV